MTVSSCDIALLPAGNSNDQDDSKATELEALVNEERTGFCHMDRKFPEIIVKEMYQNPNSFLKDVPTRLPL